MALQSVLLDGMGEIVLEALEVNVLFVDYNVLVFNFQAIDVSVERSLISSSET